MPQSRKSRPQIGDIIEVKTAKGLAYAQYTHEYTKPPRWGSLLRILPGFYTERPKDFAAVALQKELYFVFFPLKAALGQRIFEIVAHEDVPPWAVSFPLFRSGLPDREGKVHVWWLWDGEREWRVGALTPEMRSLSLCEIWNDTELISRIEAEWKPEHEV